MATTVALALGLFLVNLFHPGVGLTTPLGAGYIGGVDDDAGAAESVGHAAASLPTSVIDAMARGDIPGRGVRDALRRSRGVHRRSGTPVVDVMHATAQAMFKVTGYVMTFAPVGVFAAIGATVAGKGIAVLLTLGKLVP